MESLLIAYDFGRHYLKRGRKEYRDFWKRIESEGGTVLRANRVGRFLKSPFGGLRRRPLYYCFRCPVWREARSLVRGGFRRHAVRRVDLVRFRGAQRASCIRLW